MADIICYQQQHQYHQQHQQQQQSSSVPNYYKQQQQPLTQDYKQQIDPVRDDHLDQFKKEYPSEMIPILYDMLDIIKKDENNSLMVLLLTKMFDCILRMEGQQKINNNNIKNKFAELEKSAESRNNVLLLNYNDKMDKMINILSEKFNILENKVNEIKNGNNMNFKKILKNKFDENQIKLEKITKNLNDNMNLKKKKKEEHNKNIIDIKKQINLMNNKLLLIKKELDDSINNSTVLLVNKSINNAKQIIAGINKMNSKVNGGIDKLSEDIAESGMSGAVARQQIKEMIQRKQKSNTENDTMHKEILNVSLYEDISIPSTTTITTKKEGLEKGILSMVLNTDVIIPSTSSEILQLKNKHGLKLKDGDKYGKIRKEHLVNMKDEELNELLVVMKTNLNIEDIKNELIFRNILNERDKK